MSFNLSYALTVAALLAGPSIVTAAFSEILDDPRLRPLSMTETRMAASGAMFSLGAPYVRARIFWVGPAQGFDTAEELRSAMREALAAKGVDAHVAVIRGAPHTDTLVDLRAGRTAFGPFPAAAAAFYVGPAAEAARLALVSDRR